MDAESVLWLDGRRGVYTHAVATRGWWDDVHTNIVPIIDGLRHDNSCAHTFSATVGSLLARPTSQIAACRRPNGTRATGSGATAPQPGAHPHNTERFRRGWPGPRAGDQHPSKRLCPGKSLLLIYLCTRSFNASMPWKESLTNLPVHTLFQSVYALERVSY